MTHHPLLKLSAIEPFSEIERKPVDSELQTHIPLLLSIILHHIWAHRDDWFFGVNMGIFYGGQAALVPDAFLALGVRRWVGEGGRRSYNLEAENGVIPILAIEYVSHTYGGEYDWEEVPRKKYSPKMREYAELGVKYYVIYNPHFHRERGREPLEMYVLKEKNYIRHREEPLWMEEVGLGIGRGEGTFQAITQEWLYWYDRQGTRYQYLEELLQNSQQEAQLAQQEAQRLAGILRSMGVDLDRLS